MRKIMMLLGVLVAMATGAVEVPDISLVNEPTITVPGSIKRNLTAIFKEAQHKATTLIFLPRGDEIDWDDSAKGGTASAGGGGGRIAVRYRRNGSSLTADCCDVSGAANNKGNGTIADGQPGTVYWKPIRGMRLIVR